MKDVFICHTSEDKPNVVRPLATALQQAGVTVWLDEEEIHWGESVTGQVNKGIAESRFAVVVFSESFLAKNWPKRELLAPLNQEASDGQVKALPLIVGGKSTAERVRREYPLQNDKRYLEWTGDTQYVVREMLRLLGRESPKVSTQKRRFDIPIPKIKRNFSDREKDEFLRHTFTLTRRYFEQALQQLAQSDSRIGTDLQDVDSVRFACTIYLNGDVQQQCLIWIGGSFGSKQISYREGRHLDIQHETSINDWLNVESDGEKLYLKTMGFYSQDEKLSAEKGPEHLWKRFTMILQYR